MNCNNYRKIVHACLFFGNKIALSKVLKECYHKNYFTDCGGKVEDNENLMDAVKRETLEESGFNFDKSLFELQDCFIYPERELKTFVFKVELADWMFRNIENPEPDKQSDWKLYTIKEALKLKKLMPSVRYFLENIK